MNIISHRKIFFVFSGILALASIVSLSLWQLNFGIDFTGGSLLEVEMGGIEISPQQIRDGLDGMELVNFSVQPTSSNGFILRFQSVDEETHQRILEKIEFIAGIGKNANGETGGVGNSNDGNGLIIESLDGEDLNAVIETEPVLDNKYESGLSGNDLDLSADVESVSFNTGDEIMVTEKRFESIGPTIGKELKEKALWAIILSLLAIIVYIAWVFRKVSYPIVSWKYGIVAIVALFHDMLIVMGIFSILGKFYGMEIGLPFVAAILTVLGYSVNDTIVVFDRIRENLIKHYSGDGFDETVNQSLNQTMTRSINTSLTTLFVLFAIFIFGGESLKDFILALIFGIIFGTYSSIFIASPLLVEWEKRRKK